MTLDDGGVRPLFEGVGADGRYIESGHVVYQNQGRLLAAPFDAETLQVTGDAVPVLEGIAASQITGVSQNRHLLGDDSNCLESQGCAG